ncbi:hypothetical protein AB1286_18740 [Trinickia sp. NRRL B-1857]|uniref:hypothetical protein n=1 Tax=Trinickia sp. NRRL B-1857 TaxID=3162879 RepID=UPI003D2B9362
MPIRKPFDGENPWIAEGARYVHKDKENKLRQSELTYRLVRRRMLDRIENEMMYALVEHKGKPMTVLGSGFGALADTVHQMDYLARLIAESDGNAFDFERREDGKLIRLEEHELGQYYPLLCPLVRLVYELDLDRFRLTPHADVFRDVVKYCMDKVPFLNERLEKLPTYFDRDVRRFCGELANDLFALIRQEVKAREVNEMVSKRKYGGKRAIRRMQEFKRKCFAGRDALYVMPLECGYYPEHYATVSLDQAKRDHDIFVNRLRADSKFAAVAVGGIWSLAWGEQRGHHFRWMFLLDASLVSDSLEWMELVANVWKGVVGDGAAYVRVPGVNDAPSPIAGIIRVDDDIRMKVLDDDIEYVATKDYLIQLKEAEGARSWGTWVPAYTRDGLCRKKPV